MAHELAVAILAAGKGSRMKTQLPKPLVQAWGKPLVGYVLQAVENYDDEALIGVVVGHKAEMVKDYVSRSFPKARYAFQEEQKGTAHALQCFFHDLPEAWKSEFLLICCGDSPLLSESIFKRLRQEFIEDPGLEAVVASFKLDNPFGFGRILPSKVGFSIVEEKEASEEQKKIREVNSGVYLIRTSYIKRYLDEISSDNSAGEFYLTDLFKPDIPIKACRFQDPNLFLGVNTFEQLAEIESILRKKKIKELQEAGVYFEDPQSIYIDLTVEIEEEVRIGGMVKISGDTKISKGSIIEQGCIIKSSQIGESNHILAYSYLEKSILGPGNQIGPFARLREGTQLDGNCKIGNFVETKKAHLKEGSKASHLSYIGDAEIGERTNIGCGFITCNYDGKDKHQTKIGADSFIGSDVQMIAPVELGDEVFVAAGSTINENIPSGGFGIARSKQSTKEGMAKKFIKKK